MFIFPRKSPRCRSPSAECVRGVVPLLAPRRANRFSRGPSDHISLKCSILNASAPRRRWEIYAAASDPPPASALPRFPLRQLPGRPRRAGENVPMNIPAPLSDLPRDQQLYGQSREGNGLARPAVSPRQTAPGYYAYFCFPKYPGRSIHGRRFSRRTTIFRRRGWNTPGYE